LQRLTWGQLEADGSDGRIRRISQIASLTLFDVGQDGTENLAVTNLTQREPYVVAGRDVTFQAQIKNFGPGDRINHAVKLLVDDRPTDEKRIDVAAGEEASIAFTHRFPEAGEHVVRVELPEDGLATDNRRWLSVPVREALQVLVIGGQPGVGQHVALALSPRRRTDPLIRTEVASESAIAERDLSQYDGVFLCNVARVSRDEAAVLHEYVKSGGGLIVFLGDQVVADDYNRQLGGADDAPRLLPALLGEVAATGDYRFDPRKYEHPIVDVFRGHENTGLLTTPIKKYFKLQLPEKTEARVALWLDSGDPAIVEEQIGRGRVFLVATAASRHSLDRSTNPPTEWTIFSEFPSFPPIVHEMLAMAAGQRFENRNVLVGQPLGASVASTDVGITLDVKPPDRPAERVRLTLDGDRSVWSFTGVDQSGVYQAEFGEPISRTELFAANIDPRESDLARISADELPAELSRKLEQVQSEASSASLAGPRRYLFRWLLCGVLGLLLLETFLAWHFGNRSL
jgi:hypothetical protein